MDRDHIYSMSAAMFAESVTTELWKHRHIRNHNERIVHTHRHGHRCNGCVLVTANGIKSIDGPVMYTEEARREWTTPDTNSNTLWYSGTYGSVVAPAYNGDAGYDLVCDTHTVIAPRETVMLSTGARVALPEGTWGLITGRSSARFKLGLHVVQSVIDAGFRGLLYVGAWNPTDDKIEVPAEAVSDS